MANRLENRVSIVTGAARGMGYAIANALYHEGARVVIVDIDAEAVIQAAESLDPDGARVMGRGVDVTSKEQVQKLTREVVDAWGGIDVLVNNAGGALFTPHILKDVQEKDWNLVVDVNPEVAAPDRHICRRAMVQFRRLPDRPLEPIGEHAGGEQRRQHTDDAAPPPGRLAADAKRGKKHAAQRQTERLADNGAGQPEPQKNAHPINRRARPPGRYN